MNISLSEYFPDGILNLNVERNSSLLPDPEDGRQEEQGLNGAILHPSMIVLLVVALATISTIIALLVIKWHSQRFQQCNWASGTKRKSFFIYCARNICKSLVCFVYDCVAFRSIRPSSAGVYTLYERFLTQSTLLRRPMWSLPRKSLSLSSARSTTVTRIEFTACRRVLDYDIDRLFVPCLGFYL